jgi:chromosome segregation ATPase
MVVVVALLAATGLFFVGRWTTDGERDALAGDRDAALADRGQLQNSLDKLQHDLERANATNAAKQSTIDELKSAAAREATKLTDLETEVKNLATQSQKLQDSNEELWTHLDAVSECGNSIEFADAAFDKWAALFEALDDYLQSEVGSEQERQASERVDQAWADNDVAESDYVASSSLCARAVELLPNCTEQGPTEAAVEPLIGVDPGAPCPTT